MQRLLLTATLLVALAGCEGATCPAGPLTLSADAGTAEVARFCKCLSPNERAQTGIICRGYDRSTPKDDADKQEWLRTEKVKRYHKDAEQGDAGTQFELADMYHHGKDVRQDYAEAAKWYRKAAEQELPEAQYNLGLMYWGGQGVTRDGAQALEWFGKAAKRGFRLAKIMIDDLKCLQQAGVPMESTKVQAGKVVTSKLSNDQLERYLDCMSRRAQRP